MNRELRIIYMGTPEFAVEPLRVIHEAGYNIVAVITSPDKPAGRGQRLQASPVKEFALSKNLKVLQPLSLKNPGFIDELRGFNANLQVVVAFRMLPEVVWQMPEYGTLNLHASLLPQYRGAAPINHAIINGETETGLTTFFIEKEIDTGNIILQKKMQIQPSDDAGALHDRLMAAGGELVSDTLKMIVTGNTKPQSQASLLSGNEVLKPAPKIFRNDCRINWQSDCISIHNFVRGLSPYPGAFTTLLPETGIAKQLKVYKTSYEVKPVNEIAGSIVLSMPDALSVVCNNGILHIEELKMEGKKRMNANEFLRGANLNSRSRLE